MKDRPDAQASSPTPFQRLTAFARRVIAVPKAEVDEQAKKYRRRRAKKLRERRTR